MQKPKDSPVATMCYNCGKPQASVDEAIPILRFSENTGCRGKYSAWEHGDSSFPEGTIKSGSWHITLCPACANLMVTRSAKSTFLAMIFALPIVAVVSIAALALGNPIFIVAGLLSVVGVVGVMIYEIRRLLTHRQSPLPTLSSSDKHDAAVAMAKHIIKLKKGPGNGAGLYGSFPFP